VVEQVEQVINDLRAIQAERSCEVPVVVALSGIDVQPDVWIELPWGWLRGMDQHALRAVGDVFPSGGALLITFVKSAVVVGSAVQSEGAGPPGPSRAELQAFTREMEARVQKTTLALLLLDESPRLAVVPTRNTAITPFFGTGWGAGGSQFLPLEQRGRLAPEHLNAVATTAALVMDHYSDPLAIPTRRFASALLTRADVEDGLVDAVIGWESLFAGTDQGELSFRIAAAMAWLIEPDANERVAVHREITRLYGLRSRILHRGRASRDVRLERAP
jgi:hypothetical protein